MRKAVKAGLASASIGGLLAGALLSGASSASAVEPTDTDTTDPMKQSVQLWTILRTPIYRTAGSGIVKYLPAETYVPGILRAKRGYVQITDGEYKGYWISGQWVNRTNPGNANYGDPAKPNPVWVTPTQVQRTVLATDYNVVVRSQAGFGANIVAEVPSGTTFIGSYVNENWFKIATGTYAGRYISSGVIHYTRLMSYVNGKPPKANLCPLPMEVNTVEHPTVPRYLSCAAVQPFLAMNAQFKKQVSPGGIKVNEGGRSYKDQVFYYYWYGYPRAAMPGTSNHGLGNAIDLDAHPGSSYGFGSAADKFLTRAGRNYGFDRPAYMDRGGSNPEYWHYNFIG